MIGRRAFVASLGAGFGLSSLARAANGDGDDGGGIRGDEQWLLRDGTRIGERWVNDRGDTGLFEVPHEHRTREVMIDDRYAAGEIHVVARFNIVLWTLGQGRAIRYAAALGTEGRQFRGRAVVGRKEEWPFWQPTANMIRREPEYAKYAGGVDGGLGNPLGARALYLYRNGRDTRYRIHGTSQPWTIGQNVSSGCVRLYNHAIMDLYDRAGIGTLVRAY